MPFTCSFELARAVLASMNTGGRHSFLVFQGVTARFLTVINSPQPHTIVCLLNIIDFPTRHVRDGWNKVWQSGEVAAACEVNEQTGIVELAGA